MVSGFMFLVSGVHPLCPSKLGGQAKRRGSVNNLTLAKAKRRGSVNSLTLSKANWSTNSIT